MLIIEREFPPSVRERNGFPEFPIALSDGCTGVRQLAQWACAVHDARYHYGKTIWHKWRADVLLAKDIIKHGWEQCRSENEPWPNVVIWILVGLERGLAVALFAWRPFFGKPHKVGLTWRQKAGL